MLRGNKQAFTIIEIMFFLAISSLMMFIVFNSIASRQQYIQFTDSMRSLESFVQLQRDNSESGVNDRPGGTPGCDTSIGNCIFLGRVLLFGGTDKAALDPNNIDYYVVTGQRLTANDEVGRCAGISFLTCAEPTTEDSPRQYELFWQAAFTGGEHVASDGNTYSSRAIGFLKNPRSSTVNSVSYTDDRDLAAAGVPLVVINHTSNDIINSESNYNNTNNLVAISDNDDVKAHYCFESAGGKYQAALIIEGSTIRLSFDPTPETEGFAC